MTTGETLNSIISAFEQKKQQAVQYSRQCAMKYVMSQLDNDRNLCIKFQNESEFWQSAIQIVNAHRN
jgi:hypothetical protein